MKKRTRFWAVCAVCGLVSALAGAARADVLTYGDTLAGSLDVVGETDLHTIVADAGDIILVRLGETTSGLEPAVSLTGPLGEYHANTGSSLAEVVTPATTTAGVWTIRVWDDGHNDTGGYSLHVQRINDPGGSTALAMGSTQAGSVGAVAATVAYTLDGSAGDRILLRTTEAVTNSALTPRMRLYAPDGTLVDAAYGSYTAELNTVELPATDTYTLLVLDNNGTGIGGYSLHVQCTNDPAGAVPIAWGQTLAGTLAMRAESDAFTLTGTEFDLLVARLGETTSGLEPILRLYDAAGEQLVGVTDSNLAELPLTALPGSGTYTLLVLDSPGTDTGGYALHVQKINDPGGSTALALGSTQTGDVEVAAATVAYTLDGDAGDRILLRVAETVTNSALTPRLRLYAPDGTLVASAYGSYAAELNSVQLPAATSYTLLVLDNNGTYTGGYSLHVQRLNNPVGAVPITWGQTLAGTLAMRAETDAFTLTGTAADLLIARLGETASVMEPILRLYDAGGVQVAGVSNSTLAELPLAPLPGTGTYTLLVMDDPGIDTGGYSLHVQRVNDPGGGTALAIGSTQTGSVGAVAATVAYTLDAGLGDRILLRAAESVTNSALTPRLRLYAPDGSVVASAYGSYSAELNTVEVPATATYTLLVLDNNGTSTGGYSLHVQCTNAPVGAVPITWGQTLAGTLAMRAETDAFTLTGTAADLLIARLGETASGMEPILRLYDASGAQVAGVSNSTLAELPLAPLPGTGTYTLLVMDDPGIDTGGYSLHVQRVNDPGGGTALAMGSTQAGSVGAVAATVAYTLDGNAGDHLLLRATESVTNSALTPRLRLYAPDGSVVATNYGSYTAEVNTVQLPAAATYTLLVLDNNGTSTGGYSLHAQCTNAPVGAVSLAYGDNRPGTLALRAEAVAYVFTAASYDTVAIHMQEVTSGMEPLIRLYGPDGAQMDGATGSSEAVISGLRLNHAGTYTLLAMDNPGTDVGDYTISLVGGHGISAVDDDPEDVPVLWALHGCRPNPFNPVTTVRFDLPEATAVRLTVHDLAGRRVATLVQGILPAGAHAIPWDGRGEEGRALASGVYVVRLTAGGRESIAKATLVK